MLQDGEIVVEQLSVEKLVVVQRFQSRLNVVGDQLWDVYVQEMRRGRSVGVRKFGTVGNVGDDLRPIGENVVQRARRETEGTRRVHVQDMIEGEAKQLLHERRIIVDADQFVQLSVGFQTSDEPTELVHGFFVDQETVRLLEHATDT